MKQSNWTRTTIIVITIGVSLLVVAINLSDHFSWAPFDFAVAAALWLGAMFVYAVMVRARENVIYRVAVGLAVVTAVILVWMNLAVGIIGTEENPANLF